MQQQARKFVVRWIDRLFQCNSEECAGARRFWGRISNSAGSIGIQGQRFCFPRCSERELCRKFEAMQRPHLPQHRPGHRMPLGLLMLSRGCITNSQLRCALEAQQQHAGRRLGECLQQLGYACEPEVTSALALQWCCPVLHILPQQPVDCGVPHGILKRFQMLPVHFSVTERILHIAFSGDIEYGALVAIEQMLDCRTQACLTTPTLLEAAFERTEQHPAPPQKEFIGMREAMEMARITSSYAARLDADDLRVASCREMAWVRIDGSKDSMNLLFQLLN